MKNLETKTLAIMIALILLSSTAISLVSIPAANAHDPPWGIATTAYVSAQPNPVGVGQEMLIVMLLNWVMPGANIWNDIRPHGYILTITAPDGTNETNTYDPYDSGSSRFIKYTPNQIGNYTVTFVYPGEVYNYPNYIQNHPELRIPVSSYYENGIYNNDTFLGSSAQTTFTVQQDPVSKLPNNPLPTEYWTRPIFGQNVDWGLISSNWVGTASGGAAQADRWQKEGAAPKSAHVMWTKPARLGGWVGGVSDERAQFYLGFSYEDVFSDPLILSGILYYKEPLNHEGRTIGGTFRALDLRTGETIWTNPGLDGPDVTRPIKGQLLDFQQADQHGTVGGLLWRVIGSTWVGYDAFSGNWVVNLTGVPSGTEIYTDTGDILRYVVNSNAGWIALWNNTAAMTNAPASSASYGPDQQIRIVGQVIDASKSFVSQGTGDPTTAGNSYSWNVTLPSGVPTGTKSIVGVIPEDIILMTTTNSEISLSAIPRVPTRPWTMFAISDKPENRGHLLWSKTYDANPDNYTIMLAWNPIDPINKMWTMTLADTGQRLGFSMETGEQVWGPVGIPSSDINGKGLQYYSSREGSPAFGNLYVSGYGGQVIAYSMKNGTTLWTWDSPNSGVETPWGHYPVHIGAFADGMVFVFSGEHSPNTPIYKGYRVYAINATDGTEIWNLLDWSASGLGTSLANTAIADGYMTFLNGYDEQVYVIGKGPSATSISIQNDVAPQGSTVLIQGSVIDISAGTKQNEQAARFPNGVPAVSDAGQSGFMSYVYQQQAKPTDTIGVPVTLSVIDSNGNYRSIGETTSDANGKFSLVWTPDIEGAYTVIANFAGSESYYASSAGTAFYATAAAATPAPTQTATASMVDQYFVPAVAGIILAIVLVGVAIIVVLRKRP